MQKQEVTDRDIAAKIWFQKEIVEKLKETEKRLGAETADKTEEVCQEWQARLKVIKDVLAYLDESHCPERCKECCDGCDRPCEHSKSFQVANTMNN